MLLILLILRINDIVWSCLNVRLEEKYCNWADETMMGRWRHDVSESCNEPNNDANTKEQNVTSATIERKGTEWHNGH